VAPAACGNGVPRATTALDTPGFSAMVPSLFAERKRSRGHSKTYAFYPRNSTTTPTMDAATPPTSIHIALSVGAPVKKRDMSELNDFDALTPKMISRADGHWLSSQRSLRPVQ
jgi:hypothetical protein